MNLQKKKVLLVDDSVFHIERMRDILQGTGFEIFACVDATDATGLIEEMNESLDILITDLEMPNMSGFELLGWLRERPYAEKISTLVLTGAYDLTEIVDSLRDLNVNGVLEKGGHPQHILSRINAIAYPEVLEKRSSDRVSTRLPAKYEWRGGVKDGEITNISLGGCFIQTESLANSDENIIVRLSYPLKGREAELSGKVIWVVGGEKWPGREPRLQGMGVKWHSMEPEDRLHLEVYIEECLKTERLYFMLSP